MELQRIENEMLSPDIVFFNLEMNLVFFKWDKVLLSLTISQYDGVLQNKKSWLRDLIIRILYFIYALSITEANKTCFDHGSFPWTVMNVYTFIKLWGILDHHFDLFKIITKKKKKGTNILPLGPYISHNVIKFYHSP